MADAEVNWKTEQVILRVGKASDEIITQMAMIIADKAGINIANNDQVDTGFMMNSAYGVGPTADGRAKAEANATSRADRPLAPEPTLPKGEHAGFVHVAAEYAVYQEIMKPFLYPAIEAAAKEFKGVVEKHKL